MSLESAVAVVTGAAEGMGRAIAWKLGSEGARVAVCDRNQEGLETAAGQMAASGFRVLARVCDVSDNRQVEEFVSAVTGEWGRIRILVNNAGISKRNPILEPGDETWHEVLATNLTGVYYCTHRALPHFQDGGRIVHISSISGKVGSAEYSAYCASKHGGDRPDSGPGPGVGSPRDHGQRRLSRVGADIHGPQGSPGDRPPRGPEP